MVRLLLGCFLLAATLLTGILAGTTGETRARSVITVRTEEQIVYRDPPVPVPINAAPAVAEAEEEDRAGGPASANTRKEGLPETSDLVARMRRHLPDLGRDEAEKIRAYHKDYRKRLNGRAQAVTAMLLADPESQRKAVEKMRELRRERRQFMRDLLGARRWDKWKQVELNGGRNVDEFLRVLQEQDKENEK